MNTVFGIVCDESSMAKVQTLEQGLEGPRLRTSAWSTRASEVRPVQPSRIPIDTAHDGRPIGEIVALVRKGPNLWAIGHLDPRVREAVSVDVAGRPVEVPSPLFWSALRDSTMRDTDIMLRAISLTSHSARVAARPVQILEGQLDHRQAARRWKDQVTPHELEVLEAACESHLERRRSGGPITVVGDLQHQVVQLPRGGYLVDDELVPVGYRQARPPGAMRYRPAGRGSVLRVS